MAFLSVNQLCRHLCGKKIKLDLRQTMSLAHEYTSSMLFSWATVDVNQYKAKVSLMTNWEVCREVAALKIRDAHKITTEHQRVGLEFRFVPVKSSVRGQTYQAFVGEYISSLCYPGVIVIHGIRKERIDRILSFLHYYEKFARAGRTRIYEIDQPNVDALYKNCGIIYGSPEFRPWIGKNAHLVVFPSFWKTSAAYISMFLLIIRALSRYDDDVEAGNAKSFAPKIAGKDLFSLKFLMYRCDGTVGYVGVDTIRMFCRRWRSINGVMKKYQWPSGYSNSGVATSLANTNYYSPNIDPATKARLQVLVEENPIYGEYLKRIYELLQQEKRRMSPEKKVKAINAGQLNELIRHFRALPTTSVNGMTKSSMIEIVSEIRGLISRLEENMNEVV